MVFYGIVCIMGNEVLMVMVPDVAATFAGVASSYYVELPAIQPMPTDRWAQGLLITGDAGCVGGGGTKHCTRRFP
jgi:hypothetical protein